MSARGGGRFDVPFMLGASLANYPAWVGGTLIGVLVGSSIADPRALGLDALFPAFFLALLLEEIHGSRRRGVVALSGALIALALTPLAPPGVPVLAAGAAALMGLRGA
jgi:predicted branched-subunit amino acid permease